MRKFVALLLITTVSFYLRTGGQEIGKDDILKHRIISVTYWDSTEGGKKVEVYNDHGDLIRSMFTSGAETPDWNTEYLYNDSLQLVRSVHFVQGRNDHSSQYFYKDRQLARIETLSAANALYVCTIDYNKKGNKTKEVYADRLGHIFRTIKYTYSGQSQLTSEVTTGPDGQKKAKTLYTYNSIGQLVRKSQELTRSFTYTTTQVYNDSGRLASRTDSISNGDVFAFRYTYGRNGLLTTIDLHARVSKDGFKKEIRKTTNVIIAVGAAPKNERMLFVVDSIPILKDPEAWNPISKEDWADLSVIRNRDSIRLLGWDEVDAITFIFTRAYRSRPDSVKVIPSLRHMKLINGTWYLDNRPYTGKYIDYYNSGRIMDEGYLQEGKLRGTLTVYYQNGQKKSMAQYQDGVLHGFWKDFYPNGSLMESREYWEGKTTDARKEYFVNGRLRYEWKVRQQTPYDTAIAYYSTGKIKQTTLLREGKPVYHKKAEDLKSYTADFYRGLNGGNLQEANKAYYKLWTLDSASADTYYKGGLLMLKEFRFDEALSEFNKALEVEPLMLEAFANRALTRIKKHKFAAVKPVPREYREPRLTLEDFTALPYDEQLRVCDDLQQARSMSYGDTYAHQVLPAVILEHCQKKTSF